MKKIIIFPVFLSLVLGICLSPAGASIINDDARNEIKKDVKENISGTIEVLTEEEIGKNKALGAIDQAVYVLNYIKKNINDSYLSDYTKSQANIFIDATIVALNDLKVDLEKAESPEDIKAIIQEIKKYAQDNKDEMVSLMKAVQDEAISSTIEYLNYCIDELGQILYWLKLICPGQISEINKLIANVEELDRLLAEIEKATETGDYSNVAETVVECEGIITETLDAVDVILENC